LKTDISIKPNLNQSIKVTGNLEARDFNIGKLLQKEKLFGEMTMQLDVDGSVYTDHSLNGNINGNISSFEFNKYDYQNIQLNGTFNNKSFDGSINIDDPNIKFDFLGLVDMGKEIHEFDFSLVVPRANLSSLNLVPADTSSNLSFIMTSSITGNNIENMNGNIKFINARYQSRGKEIESYNLYLEANSNPDSSWLVLNTEYADISLTGNYEFNKIIPSFYFLQEKFLPSTIKNFRDTTNIFKNDFHFNAKFKNLAKITDFFFPSIEIAPDSWIKGTFQPSRKELILEGNAKYFYTGNNLFENPHFILASKKFNNLTFMFNAKDLLVNNKFGLSTLDLHSDFRNDSIFLGLSWFQKDSLLYKANINITTVFSRDIPTNSLQTNIYIPATTIVHKSIPWEINENSIQLDSNSIHFHNFLLKNKEKALSIDGMISTRPTDTLYLKANNMRLKTQGLLQNKLQIEGIVNGEARLSGLYDSIMFLSQIQINDLHINEVPFGTGVLNTFWDNETKSVKLYASTKKGTLEQFHAEGNYFNSSRSIALDIDLNKFKINSFLPFLSSVSSKLEGIVSGKLEYSGKLKEPVINGKLNLQKASMTIDYLNTNYSFSAPVEIKNNVFHLNNIEVFDTLGNKAIGNGRILTNHFKDLSFDLKFDAENMLMVNLDDWQNDYFYGTVYGSGSILLYGSTDDLTINISATTNTNTQFFIPLDKGKEFSDLNYIKFVSREPIEMPRERRRTKTIKKNIQTGKLKLNIELNITPDAEASVLFDPNAGGSLTGKGTGNIRMGLDANSNFSMSGDYIIDRGIYNFSLSQVINKKFEVKQGSKITWTGDPVDADLDVIAIYPVRTTLSTLFEYEENAEEIYNRRVPVDCEIHLTGKLETPNISFNIDLPSSNEEIKTKLNNVIDTEEKLNRQFLALLVMNRFISPQGGLSTNDALGTTGYELLSNQLSNWLSQISDDFDIGFHYRPGDAVSGQEIELALSTQILNNRVIINSGIGQEEVNKSNNIVGDVSVEVKIDKKGKFRVKAFTRPRTNEIPDEETPYISGVGIFFREEFNSFGALVNSYWDRIFKKKKKGKKDKNKDK
ncbi:MAG: translocation/assembly module TamB, partial [Bacteroidales bacterium]|nr:translocation/assembly module TamB [Bacteroidales bacterium]